MYVGHVDIFPSKSASCVAKNAFLLALTSFFRRRPSSRVSRSRRHARRPRALYARGRGHTPSAAPSYLLLRSGLPKPVNKSSSDSCLAACETLGIPASSLQRQNLILCASSVFLGQRPHQIHEMVAAQTTGQRCIGSVILCTCCHLIQPRGCAALVILTD